MDIKWNRIVENKSWRAITVIVFTLILVTEPLTPLGFAHGTLYLLPLYIAGLSLDRTFISWTASAAVSATIIGPFVSPEGVSLFSWMSNRGVSCAALAGSAYLIKYIVLQATHSEENARSIKRASSVLQNSEVLGPLGFFEVDLEKNELFWSDAMFPIFQVKDGKTPETLEAVLEYLVPEDRIRVREAISQSITAGHSIDDTCRIRTPSGEQRILRFAAGPLQSDGRTYFSGITQDITENQARTQRLRLLESAIEMLNDIVIITEANDINTPTGPNIVYVNNALERVTGYRKQELVGKTPRILQGPNTQRDQLDKIRAGLERGEPVVAELINYTAQGDPFWLELSIAVVRDEADRPTHFVAVERDVTERKRAAEAVRVSEERFRRITRATHDVFWELNLATYDLWWSENGQSVFGFRPTKNSEWLDRVHPDDQARLMEGLKYLDHRHEDIINEQYRLKDSSGNFRNVLDRSTIIRDESGRAITMVGSMRDATEVHEMERQLRHTQKMEAIGRLSGGISHDINNYLTIILGNVDLLDERLDENSELRRYVSEATDAAERAANLTSRLLTFARGQTLVARNTDINDLIGNLVPLIERALPKGVSMSVDLKNQLPAALVDKEQLEVAILNLVFNARDAMPKGGSVRISTEDFVSTGERANGNGSVRAGHYVCIHVADTGTGMSPEILERIFEPFFTTKDTGEGTGLGLSMTYGFAAQSGGSLTVESVQGKGSTFNLLLPATEADARTVIEPEGALPPHGDGERILLVEDELVVRRQTADTLTRLGYNVTSASDAQEGKRVLEKEPDYDLLLTDVMMPGVMNGRDLGRWARKYRPHLCVLYITGYSENVFSETNRMEGDNHILRKPFRRSQLAKAVKSALGQRTNGD